MVSLEQFLILPTLINEFFLSLNFFLVLDFNYVTFFFKIYLPFIIVLVISYFSANCRFLYLVIIFSNYILYFIIFFII